MILNHLTAPHSSPKSSESKCERTLVRGELGKGELGKGELGKGELGKGERRGSINAQCGPTVQGSGRERRGWRQRGDERRRPTVQGRAGAGPRSRDGQQICCPHSPAPGLLPWRRALSLGPLGPADLPRSPATRVHLRRRLDEVVCVCASTACSCSPSKAWRPGGELRGRSWEVGGGRPRAEPADGGELMGRSWEVGGSRILATHCICSHGA